jgi:multidrug efflux pump
MLPLGLVGAVTAVNLRMPAQRRLPADRPPHHRGAFHQKRLLIIQFIKEQMRQGHELVEATLTAIKIRFARSS